MALSGHFDHARTSAFRVKADTAAQALRAFSCYKVFMWGRIIISAVIVVLVAVWLAAIWVLIVDPRALLPKLPTW